MSFQAMTWAVDAPCKSPGQKLVLLMLSNHTNGHTGQCTPTHKRLAEECCMGVSTLKGHLLALEQAGLIRIIRRSAEGVDLPNQYLLLMGQEGSESDRGVSTATPPPGQNLTGGGSESDRRGGQNLATEPGNRNQEKEPGNTPLTPQGGTPVKPAAKAAIQKPIDVHDQTWNDFLDLRHKKRAPVTETAIRQIRAEAGRAGMTLNDALEHCCAKGWQGFSADWVGGPKLRGAAPKADRADTISAAKRILWPDEPDAGDVVEG